MAQTPTANELNRFQALLEARITELETATRMRDAIAVEPSADQIDEIQRASERALAISNVDRDTKQLRSARAALRRIREGAFGMCEECEEEIHPKRCWPSRGRRFAFNARSRQTRIKPRSHRDTARSATRHEE
jgi:RNA polymerase-binding transcription factor DksA